MGALLRAARLRFDPRPGLSHVVDFALGAGGLVHVCGPSGSGKTTLLRVLARLSAKSEGEIYLSGASDAQVPPTVWRRRVAYLPQQPVMLAGSVHDNLMAGFCTRSCGGASFDLERAHLMMQMVGLESDQVLSQDARLLSGGEAARVALCRALLIEPAVVLADELTSQLDAARSAATVDLLGGVLERGGGVIVVAHDATPWRELMMRADRTEVLALDSTGSKAGPEADEIATIPEQIAENSSPRTMG